MLVEPVPDEITHSLAGRGIVKAWLIDLLGVTVYDPERVDAVADVREGFVASKLGREVASGAFVEVTLYVNARIVFVVISV